MTRSTLVSRKNGYFCTLCDTYGARFTGLLCCAPSSQGVWGEPGARYVEREGQTFSDAPAPSPRLPNGSGLVRKRKFVPPGRLDNTNSNGNAGGSGGGGGKFPGSAALGAGRARGDGAGKGAEDGGDDNLPEELQHLEKTMVDKIVQEIQQRGDPVRVAQHR